MLQESSNTPPCEFSLSRETRIPMIYVLSTLISHAFELNDLPYRLPGISLKELMSFRDTNKAFTFNISCTCRASDLL